LKATRHISLIRGFRPRQQFGYIGLQLRLDLAGMCRLALAWIVVPSSPIWAASPRDQVSDRRCKKGRRVSDLLIARAVANMQPQRGTCPWSGFEVHRCHGVGNKTLRTSKLGRLHVQDG
jgi:hypothetical protein